MRFDEERTGLGGGAADFGVSKFAGSPWRIGTGFQTRTPGFEVNDLGYQRDADYLVHWVWGGYHSSAPRGPVPQLVRQPQRLERLEQRHATAPEPEGTST